MEAEQEKLYAFIVENFEEKLKRISPACVAPLIEIRRVVKAAIEKYMQDHYSCSADPIKVFGQEDFEAVSRRILGDKSKQ